MKKVSIVGPLGVTCASPIKYRNLFQVTLAAGLALALWCGDSKSAHAAWQMHYEWTGTTEMSGGYSWAWEPKSELNQDCGGFMTPYEGNDGTVKVWFTGDMKKTALDGTVTAVFNWQGTDPVPKTLYVRVDSYAEGTASCGKPSSGSDWDYDVKAHATSSQSTDDDTEGPDNARYSWASGSKVVPKPTGGSREVRVETTLHGEGTVDIDPEDQTQNAAPDTSAYLSIKVEELDYSLSLSRAGAPGAKRKGMPGVIIDEDKDEWIDEDGEGHGHSTYSYNDFHGSTVPDFPDDVLFPKPNVQNFYADKGSGWTASSTGSWSPSDDTDTDLTHSQEMPFGDAHFNTDTSDWEGSATGKSSKVIGFKYTDTGVVPTITEDRDYNLTLHDHFELIPGTHVVNSNKMVNLRPHPYDDGLARCSGPGQDVTVTCTQTHDWSITGALGGAPAKFMADVLGIEVGGSVGGSIGTEKSFTITDMKPGESTYLEVFDIVDTHTGSADEWNTGGWAGMKIWTFDVPSSPHAYGAQAHYPYTKVSGGGDDTPGGNG